MDKLIYYLIDNSNKYDLDIIDDSENHNIIFVGFPNPTTILYKDVKFLNVKELKYNTETHEYVLCAEDDFEIGYIQGKNLI